MDSRSYRVDSNLCSGSVNVFVAQATETKAMYASNVDSAVATSLSGGGEDSEIPQQEDDFEIVVTEVEAPVKPRGVLAE